MNKKGFTLVELLAVIILLFLIITFALPQITNSVNNNRKKTDEITLEMIKSAAKLYVSDNESEFPKVDGNVYYVELKDLIEHDYLKANLEYEDEIIDESKKIGITYNNGFSYYLMTNDTCTLVSDVDKSDSITPGDKCLCEVKPGTVYAFYVLSYNDNEGKITTDLAQMNTVNLIMERDMYYDSKTNTIGLEGNEISHGTEWISVEDYGCAENEEECPKNDKGPVTVFKYLHNVTQSWSNVPNIIMNYDDENLVEDIFTTGQNGYTGIYTTGTKTVIKAKNGNVTLTLNNLKARLPMYVELDNVGCLFGGKAGDATEEIVESCPFWIVNYLELDVKFDIRPNGFYLNEEDRIGMRYASGYWTLFSTSADNRNAWNVSPYGYVDSGASNPSGVTDKSLDIRPVITVEL